MPIAQHPNEENNRADICRISRFPHSDEDCHAESATPSTYSNLHK
jgi:hypothetical protein